MPDGPPSRRVYQSLRALCSGEIRPLARSTSAPSAPASTRPRSSCSTSGRSSLSRASRWISSSTAGTSIGLGALVAEEQRRRLQVAHQVSRVGVGQRRDPVGDVAEQLRRRARHPERHDRAEQRVLEAADRDRDPGVRHVLHHEPGVVGVVDGVHHVLPRGVHVDLVVDVAPDVGQVGPLPQPVGGRLEHDVPAVAPPPPRSPPPASRPGSASPA